VRPHVVVRCEKVTVSNAQEIGFSGADKDVYWWIEISDNGIGFDPQYKDKIFQLFQRLHGRSEYEGSGIGLAIVQKVVSNHQGYITATGVPSNGATFTVLLPAD
jgi:signal transduction histidine kinase